MFARGKMNILVRISITFVIFFRHMIYGANTFSAHREALMSFQSATEV
jgi:hypothetical protein